MTEENNTKGDGVFRDSAGRVWRPRIYGYAVVQLDRVDGCTLRDLFTLNVSPGTVLNFIWVCCKEQAESMAEPVSYDDFMRSLGPRQMAEAFEAVSAQLVNDFPELKDNTNGPLGVLKSVIGGLKTS